MNDSSRKLSIGKNMLWNTCGSLVYFFCQWLLTLIVVRVSGDYENAGDFSLAISVTNVFHTIASFALRTYIVSDTIGKFSTREYTAIRILTSALSVVLCVGYINLFDYTFSQKLCIFVYMLFRLGEVTVDLLHSFEQKQDRMDIGGRSLMLRGILSVAAFSVALKLSGSLIISILAMLTITFIEIAVYDLRAVRPYADIKPDFTRKAMRSLFLEGLPITASSVFAILVTTIPRQTLEALCGEEQLGYYATVATPAVIVQVAATYVFAPMLSGFSRSYNNKNAKSFLSLFLKTLCVLLASIPIVIILTVLLGDKALELLYGAEIIPYTNLLLPVIVSTIANAFVLYLWNVLIIMRKLRLLAAVSFVDMLICLVFSRFFIDSFGLNGTSLVIIAAYLTGLVQMTAIFIITFKKHFSNNNELKENPEQCSRQN